MYWDVVWMITLMIVSMLAIVGAWLVRELRRSPWSEFMKALSRDDR